MSLEAVLRVRDLRGVPGLQKAILTYLASYAAPVTGLFFTKVDRGVAETGFARSTFIEAVTTLADAGFIADTGDRIGYNNRTVVWRLRPDLIGSPSDLLLNGNGPPPVGKGPQPGPFTRDELKGKKKRAPQAPLALVEALPPWLPLEPWEGYIRMRMERKKPATDYAIRLLIRRLDAMRKKGIDLSAVLETSIVNGWTDVYEPRLKRDGTPVAATASYRGAV